MSIEKEMDKAEKINAAKRALLIGKTRDLLKKGYSCSEIAMKLNVSESTVRSCKESIDTARANGYEK